MQRRSGEAVERAEERREDKDSPPLPQEVIRGRWNESKWAFAEGLYKAQAVSLFAGILGGALGGALGAVAELLVHSVGTAKDLLQEAGKTDVKWQTIEQFLNERAEFLVPKETPVTKALEKKGYGICRDYAGSVMLRNT